MISKFFERIMHEPYTQVELPTDGTLEIAHQVIVVGGRRTRVIATKIDELPHGHGVFSVAARSADNQTPPIGQTLVPSMAFPDREAALKAGRKEARRRRPPMGS